MLAYQNIYASQGNMTQGTDGKTIDAMSLSRIDGIIASLKNAAFSVSGVYFGNTASFDFVSTL